MNNKENTDLDIIAYKTIAFYYRLCYYRCITKGKVMSNNYIKTIKEVVKYALDYKLKESGDSEISLSHDVINKVSIYTNNKYSEAILGKHDYMVVKYKGYELTIHFGELTTIGLPAGAKSYLVDVTSLANDMLLAIKGTPVQDKDYTLESPKSIVENHTVEVANPEHETKANILDQLLSRSISIGEK